MTRILQGNLNRSAFFHNIMWGIARNKNVDFLVVSQPNLRKIAEKDWIIDESESACVLSVGQIPVLARGLGYGFVRVEQKDLMLKSVYVSPNCKMSVYRNY